MPTFKERVFPQFVFFPLHRDPVASNRLLSGGLRRRTVRRYRVHPFLAQLASMFIVAGCAASPSPSASPELGYRNQYSCNANLKSHRKENMYMPHHHGLATLYGTLHASYKIRTAQISDIRASHSYLTYFHISRFVLRHALLFILLAARDGFSFWYLQQPVLQTAS